MGLPVLLTLSHFQTLLPDGENGSEQGAEMFCLYSIINSHGTTHLGQQEILFIFLDICLFLVEEK